MWPSAVSLFLLSSLALETLAQTYNLDISYVGQDFLNDWTFEAITDPTGGRVTYVDQATALADNLTYVSGDTLIMRCDDTTVLTSSDSGRNSVRIKSTASYTTHVVVFDIRHMPEGCGTWPAAWETNDVDWPTDGEVDIVRVNNVTPNTISLHVGDNCTMPATRTMLGTASANNCDVNTDGNSGCGVQNPSSNSFGPDFNSAGGGWYAMERTNSYIQVWFWSRTASSVPSQVSSGAVSSIDTSTWGEPTALFPDTSCSIANSFGPNNIIFDLTLCGSWAGIASVYTDAGCPSDCVDYVNNNPSAFTKAYWDVAGVYVYT